MAGLAYLFLFLVILIPLLYLAYIFYARLTAQRAGRPQPSFASFIPFSKNRSRNHSSSSNDGILHTVRSKIQSLTGGGNSAHRSGAYEQPLGSARGRGLDPDGAWDARVGDEADHGGYYEEQELGLHPVHHGGYGGHGTELPDYGDEEMGRGRSISRDGPGFIGGDQRGLDERYEREMKRQRDGEVGEDPFGDHAETRSQLRGVSSRPTDGEGHERLETGSLQGDSPTERRSMFKENM
ncbi:MAG: hypothetical protein LQ350_002804 [Teloschistes chrysophthalmus]|nr:MAG: hypothetical protein LQ350_002804 [Niorma chrysophthalma]